MSGGTVEESRLGTWRGCGHYTIISTLYIFEFFRNKNIEKQYI